MRSEPSSIVGARRGARALLALAAALWASGCLLAPNDGQSVCGANASVSFSGYLPWPDRAVVLQASASPDGPWQTIGTAQSGTAGISFAGITIYAFQKWLPVPVWTSDGATLRSYVRARVNAGSGGQQLWSNLATFDVTTPSGQPPAVCIAGRIQQGETLNEAVGFCASEGSPVVELSAPALSTCPCRNTIVNGDVTIDSAQAAAQYVCMQTLNGSLTVTESAPEVVPLPALQQIAGGVNLNYGYPFQQFGSTQYRRRTIDLPLLTTIGGDALLEARRTQGPKAVPLGMDAVTSVGGDIAITLADANPGVFNGLTAHAGDLTIQGFPGGNLDMSAAASFTSLTEVGGNVLVRDFFATQSVLNQLEQVGGDVTVARLRFYPSPSFVALQSVAGDLHFVAMKQFGPTWPALISVGGELGMIGQAATTELSALPVGAVNAFALRIADNPALVDLTGTSVQIGGGDIAITGNTSLGQCQVDAFLAAQAAAGWTGAALVADTVPCSP